MHKDSRTLLLILSIMFVQIKFPMSCVIDTNNDEFFVDNDEPLFVNITVI